MIFIPAYPGRGFDMENWIWKITASSSRWPHADFDDRQSLIPSHRISSVRILSDVSPSQVVLQMRRLKSQALNEMHYVPNDVRCPIVDGDIAEIIMKFSGDDVQFLPVTINMKDGKIGRYCYARPLLGLPCVDVSSSEISDWVVPGERILYASRVDFKSNCLLGKHFARDIYTSHVIISQDMRDELFATGDKGLNFIKPEDMVWGLV